MKSLILRHNDGKVQTLLRRAMIAKHCGASSQYKYLGGRDRSSRNSRPGQLDEALSQTKQLKSGMSHGRVWQWYEFPVTFHQMCTHMKKDMKLKTKTSTFTIHNYMLQLMILE